ncbi:ferredoxin reductase family protein [Rhodococcus sp. OK302]|uniref:ferredoxin reductase family protein n=1 Tax=Rhodococcus sp. OK302 TaxID=1882769 RepID=UPI0020CBB667|nr:ferredoxin reductase family protein [Rhodococcus sp. OK302]
MSKLDSMTAPRGLIVDATTRRGPIRSVSRGVRDGSIIAAWVVVVGVTSLWISDGGIQDLFGSASEVLTSTGRLTGLIASALLLIQVFLMARVPMIEKAWGQDGLTRMHRIIGFSSFVLMILHIGLVTLGYADADPRLLWTTTVDFALNYPGLLLAAAGTAALIMVVATSVRGARRRLRYESWHLIHLYGYLGAGLALPHQLWTGQEFLNSTPAAFFWWTLYAVCAGAVIVYRVALPLWKSLREPIRVLEVRSEGDRATTVTVGGSGVERLKAQGGQYFQWRFLDGPGWSRAHPYSLSAAPDGVTLRFTAAVVGDGSTQLRSLRRGTRVLLEGPYGRMHPGVRSQPKSLLIGAGAGIAPMCALLESLPPTDGDVTVVYRTRTSHDALLGDELEGLCRQRGAVLRIVEGHRIRDRSSWLPQQAQAWDDTDALRSLCPDVAQRDVFICGPKEWSDAVCHAARTAGTPPSQIHVESFQP